MALGRRGWLGLIACSCLLGGLLAIACGSFQGSDESGALGEDGGDAGSNMLDGAAFDGRKSSDGGSAGDACSFVFSDSFQTLDLGHWTQDVQEGGALSIDFTDFVDAPSSLHSTCALEGGAQAHAALVRKIPLGDAGVGRVDLAFAVKIEAPVGALTYDEIGCELDLRDSNEAETVALLSRFSDGTMVAHVNPYFSGSNALTTNLINAPGINGWFDGTITAVVNGTSAQFWFLLRNRATGVEYTGMLTGAVPPNVDHARISCGIAYASLDLKEGGASVSAHVDDVAFRQCTP